MIIYIYMFLFLQLLIREAKKLCLLPKKFYTILYNVNVSIVKFKSTSKLYFMEQ